MDRKNINWLLIAMNIIILVIYVPVSAQKKQNVKLTKKAIKLLDNWNNVFIQWGHLGKLRIDSVSVLAQSEQVELYFSRTLSYMPVREASIDELKKSLHSSLKRKFKAYKIIVFSGGYEYRQLLPNIFRETTGIDSSRIYNKKGKDNLIEEIDGLRPSKGLYLNHIALWHSHGWYYESKEDRWEWQRARLYGTVEDISPMTYVLPYLVPMLENAGATVFLPRERDIQIREVIVDEDSSTGKSEFILNKNVSILSRPEGFALKDTLFPGENPFHIGKSIFVTNTSEPDVATYVPEIPQKGAYAIYISYRQDKKNSSDVIYNVNHTGGQTAYKVNQTIGGGTWIYLGNFVFDKGKNKQTGSLKVSCSKGQVSLDAVKFGGGMGNIARRPSNEVISNQRSLKSEQVKKPEGKSVSPEAFTWKTSNKPRYFEGARYWLQYAGMPDTLVFSLNGEKNDYNDDYQSRGEWVNYLMGKPNGPENHRDIPGLSIPVDLALAFHTDAGITSNDSTIGTLGIYSTVRDKRIFPNGKSKLASRDMTDIIQTQIVDDIRMLYDKKWTRRGMWDREYSEAWRPNVPTMLLELLSHQNLADVKLSLDPRFRFDVSRSIYKGILKFQAFQEGRKFVVQPLPVDNMAIQKINEKEFELSWQSVGDPLESSAKPTRYKVYHRIGENGFDNGRIVDKNSYRFIINQPDEIHSYKVAAINEGGESMPGEILSVGLASESSSTVLVVNAFDRICGPAIIDNHGFAGIAWWEDQGVPYKKEIGFVGKQYDFDRKSKWLDDDNPGWGASYGNMEGKIIPGNTFDFVYTHGEAILATGHSFVSVSDEAFNADYNTNSYKIVDIILGEEKTTPRHKNPKKSDFKIFTQPFMNKLKNLTGQGTNIFLSGAYVGSDFIEQDDSVAMDFAKNVLHYKWRTNYAVKTGNVYTTDYASPFFNGNLNFNTSYNPDIYTVEAPDAIEPEGEGAVTAWRYKENQSSAGVIYNGQYKTVILGFPFETIVDKPERHQLMRLVMNYFIKQDNKQ